jgi:solute carrier family 25 (mitochondrial phosphate transporter), member 3
MGKQVSFDIFAKLLYGLAEASGISKDPNMQQKIRVLISFLASASASVIACISSQPGDMILTATYKGGHGGHGHGPPAAAVKQAAAAAVAPVTSKLAAAASSSPVAGKIAAAATAAATKAIAKAEKKESFSEVIAGIYKARGLGGFYVGLEARLAHVAAIITSQLMLYDVIKVALGLPLTGSH